MKISDLRRIIQEELSSILSENAPAKEKEEKKTIEAPPTTKPAKPQPRRKIGREDIPRESPTPAKALKETEKEKINLITQRFLKLTK